MQLTFSARQWLREESSRKQLLHVPFRRALRLPAPVDPTGVFLVSIHLCFDELAYVALLGAGEIGNGAIEYASGAGAYVGASGESAVVAST